MKPESHNNFPFGAPKKSPVIENVFETVSSLLQSKWQNKNEIYKPKKLSMGLGQLPWNLKTVIEWSNFITLLILIKLCSAKYNIVFNLRKKNEQIVIRGYQVMSHFRGGSRSPSSLKEFSILNVSEILDLDPPL